MRIAAISAALLALPLTGTAPALADDAPPVPRELWQAYGNAIEDAAVSRPGEVVTDLLVPTPADPRTQWRTIDGQQYLLVQTIDSQAVSTVSPGEAFPAGSDIWIAVPGEMDEVCTEYGCSRMDVDELGLTFQQVLGMPPDVDTSVLSRFWVKPMDLVRPCTNVDVMVSSCPQLMVNTIAGGTDWAPFLFGQGMYSWRMPRHGTPMPRMSCDRDDLTVADGNCYGFPWTRLGYTYDWSPHAKDDRGVTEFVVPEGSTVYLESVGTQRDAYPYRR